MVDEKETEEKKRKRMGNGREMEEKWKRNGSGNE